MTVYVVLSWIMYEGESPEAVFSTRELAQKYVSDQGNQRLGHDSPDSQIYYSGNDDNGYEIRSMEVDYYAK